MKKWEVEFFFSHRTPFVKIPRRNPLYDVDIYLPNFKVVDGSAISYPIADFQTKFNLPTLDGAYST